MKLFRTKVFKKDINKIKFKDKQYQSYIENISLLLQKKKLPDYARNHQLIGNYSKYKEFHISGDLLVIYIIEDDTLKLIRIGTHSQLFK